MYLHPIETSSLSKNQRDYRARRIINQNFINRELNLIRGKSQNLSKQIIKEIQMLPKTKNNIQKQMNKIGTNRQAQNKNIDQIVLMQSSIFPTIYFKKSRIFNQQQPLCATYQNNVYLSVKLVVFPENVQALHPYDQRIPTIFKIVTNLFTQIPLYIFNILTGENLITNSFYIFFSDSEIIPYSRCCNAPVYIQLSENGAGKMLCNSINCKAQILAEFLINFDDGKKLWKNLRYFSEASEKDRALRERISRLINSGKYRRMNLVAQVQNTSRQIVGLFYDAKIKQRNKLLDLKQKSQNFIPFHKVDEQQQTLFLTKNYLDGKQIINQSKQYNSTHTNQIAEKQLAKESGIPDGLPTIFTQTTYGQLQNKISQGLVSEGLVFKNDFKLIKKIDHLMIARKGRKQKKRINFPKIISEITKEKQKIEFQKINQSVSSILT